MTKDELRKICVESYSLSTFVKTLNKEDYAIYKELTNDPQVWEERDNYFYAKFVEDISNFETAKILKTQKEITKSDVARICKESKYPTKTIERFALGHGIIIVDNSKTALKQKARQEANM